MPSLERTRSRHIQTPGRGIETVRWERHFIPSSGMISDPAVVDQSPVVVFEEESVVRDFNNRGTPLHTSKKAKSGYIAGQGFDLRKLVSEPSPSTLPGMVGYYTTSPDGPLELYTGAISADAFGWAHLPTEVLTDDDGNLLDYNPDFMVRETSPYYLRARNDLRPDLPAFQLFRELAELRDIPGLIRQTRDLLSSIVGRTLHLRGAANGYLALQFGYLPVVSSIRKFLDLRNTINKRIQQLIRDDGRSVHRRRDYQTHAKTKRSWDRTITGKLGFSTIPIAIGDDEMVTHFHVSTSQRVWAVGTYMYHLPEGVKDLKWAEKLAKKLAGFYPTPQQLYDLVPWTWLIDWFTNIGELVHSFDAGVANSGAYQDFYMMCERRSVVDVTFQFRTTDLNGQTLNVNVHSRLTAIRKYRGVLGPFDFQGENPENFSGFQQSIIAALGISKFPRLNAIFR